MTVKTLAILATTRRAPLKLLALAFVAFALGACGDDATATGSSGEPAVQRLTIDEYTDKFRGSWQATMVANRSGIDLQGLWLAQPGPGSEIELLLPAQWSTDDDTHVEWLDLHIMETYGVDPTYEQIRDEWVDHLNNDIWVATLQARQLMDEGVLPPETGAPDRNPDGAWSMDAQLETELFGLISPGAPNAARDRARFFAEVTNRGPAVAVSQFYAHLYAEAFFEGDLTVLIDRALAFEPEGSDVAEIVTSVKGWHADYPNDWRQTRREIRDRYDTDPEWWASRVNFAVTVMALLYGEHDLIETINIAGLAGWDADNNMTTSAGLLGLILGFQELPEPIRSSTDVYFNEDLTGDLPQFDSVTNIADRTVTIGTAVVRSVGGTVSDESLLVPIGS